MAVVESRVAHSVVDATRGCNENGKNDGTRHTQNREQGHEDQTDDGDARGTVVVEVDCARTRSRAHSCGRNAIHPRLTDAEVVSVEGSRASRHGELQRHTGYLPNLQPDDADEETDSLPVAYRCAYTPEFYLS